MNQRYFPRKLVSGLILPTLLAAMFVAISARTVTAQEDDVIRTETSLVQLNVGVVDRQGRAVRTLSQHDFVVYEDGVKQSILHFEPTSAPFSLVLMLDTSGSTVNFRQQLKMAAFRFLDALDPDDRVQVIQFNAKVKTLADFSTDRKKTAYAIELADGAGETHFYDALQYALRGLAKEGKRRKAIVVLTDGLDTSMRNADRSAASGAKSDEEAIKSINPMANGTLNRVLNQADRQGVTIYPLALPSGDAKRLPLPDPVITGIYTAARQRLQTLADRTGGRIHEIQRLDQMARLYMEVAADLRSLYTVAYQPPGERQGGKWHDVRIEVARPELIARTRPGYFAQ